MPICIYCHKTEVEQEYDVCNACADELELQYYGEDLDAQYEINNYSVIPTVKSTSEAIPF